MIARRSKDDEKVEWEELYVDIGARDGVEARGLVEFGDPMVVAGPPVELAGGRIASRSLDNRAGVYVALEALRQLEGVNVAVVAAAQEGSAPTEQGQSSTGSGRTSRSRSTSPTRPTSAPTARARAASTSSAAARRSSAGRR